MIATLGSSSGYMIKLYGDDLFAVLQEIPRSHNCELKYVSS